MKPFKVIRRAVVVAFATATLMLGVAPTSQALTVETERFTSRNPSLTVTALSPFTVKYQVGVDSATATVTPLTDTSLRLDVTARPAVGDPISAVATAVLNEDGTVTATATGPAGTFTQTTQPSQGECGDTRCKLAKAAGTVAKQAICTGFRLGCVLAKGAITGATYLYCRHVGCDGLECTEEIEIHDTTGVWPDAPGRAIDIRWGVYCSDDMQRIDMEMTLFRGSTAVKTLRKTCFYQGECTDHWTASSLQKGCYEAFLFWSADWVHPSTGEEVELGGNEKSNKICFTS